ncbi:kinesin-like protein KIF9 [Amphibalanus amphitrite]|uniref:kinesin-like protein KIF9 n=1 Tax=Amphibalanus amphitrite TaxID=1232801 RepID=UPI001C91F2B9|nr:kinesin-like protein KIF9 [Amphibalanus amphitrite]
MPDQPITDKEPTRLSAREYNSPESTFRQAADRKRGPKLGKCEPYRPDPVGPRPVATFVRFAPTSCFDHECIKVDRENSTVDIECGAANGKLLCSKKGFKAPSTTLNRKFLSFGADMVFLNASQDYLFTHTMEDMVDKALNGFSGTMMACGPVAAGKTYTLFSPGERYPYRGLVARTIERVFKTLSEWDERTAAVTISFIEIVGENVYDLLSPKKKPITIVDNGKTFELKGMTRLRVITAELALTALFRGCALRTSHPHPRNARGSSTGHALLSVGIESRSLVETEPFDRHGELSFVDLAGFEKIRSWESGTDRPGPGVLVDVNKSMTFLEQLIMSMADNRSYMPVRVSKLTHILRSKIGNQRDTRLVACVSGEQGHLAETLATLRFAVRLRGVICAPKQEVIDDPTLLLSKLKKDLTCLRQELDMQDMMARRAPKMHGDLSHQERALVQDQVELYLDGKLEQLQVVSVKQIEAVLEAVKTTQARRETTLREQLTAELQQQMQQQLQQLQQQLTAGPQPVAASDPRPSVPAHGRERGSKRRPSRGRVGRGETDDDRSTPGDRSRRDERTPGAASADQSGPGFGVGVADGRPNAAAVAMSSRGRGRGAGGRAAASSSPPASVAEEPVEEAEVPPPTDTAPATSQEALRQLLEADGGQLQAELDRAQGAVAERHQLYAAASRQLCELRCQHSSLMAELQLLQAERHVQGERYDAEDNLVLSAEERQLTGRLRRLSAQLADCQDSQLTLRRELVEAQRQLTERRAALAAALADFRLRHNVVPEEQGAAGAARVSSDTAASAGVQHPPGAEPGAPGIYYTAQKRARAQLRRSRCAK